MLNPALWHDCRSIPMPGLRRRSPLSVLSAVSVVIVASTSSLSLTVIVSVIAAPITTDY